MASCTRCPRCQSTLTSGEVSVDLKNKGRWYWSCSSARCRYFRWDEPLHPFIQYSPEVYQSVSHAPPSKFARQLSYYNKEDGYVELPRTKTRFAFSLISETQIALKATLTATLEPLVRSIPHIRYDEQHDHWVMPASEGAYSRVLKMLPVQTPNLQIDIDGIPINMLKEMTKGKRNGLHEFRDLEEREIETHLMDLLELPYYSKLKSFQKEGIKKGVEQHGRVLLGNEYGIGLVEEAVVLSQLYEKDNPVLILCPSHMMSTWKDEMVRIFDMDPHTIKIIRKKKGMFDAPIVIRKIRQRKRKRVRILKQVFIEHGTRDFTDPIMLEESYEDGYEYITEQYTPTIRYYLMDYFDAIQCSDRILERRFGTVIMDGSQCLKHNNRKYVTNLSELMSQHRRAILLSESALHSQPVDLYHQISVVNSGLFNSFSEYSKRYCGPVASVFGMEYSGNSNDSEFYFMLRKLVWHAPRLKDMADEVAPIVRNNIMIYPEDYGHNEETEVGDEAGEMPPLTLDKQYEDAYKQKSKFILTYLHHILSSYRPSKIYVFFRQQSNLTSILEYLRNNKVGNIRIMEKKTAGRLVDIFKDSKCRVALVDMNLQLKESSLKNAGLVIFTELPESGYRRSELESYLESERPGEPIHIRYLVAPETSDKDRMR